MEKDKKKENLEVENKDKSFIDKIKNDKKYSAKVQLIGYGVLILALVLYLNISNTGNSIPISNSLVDSNNKDKITENTEQDKISLLKQLNNNYLYSIDVEIKKQNKETEETILINYLGKSYDNQLELKKEDKASIATYYKVDERYYSKEEEELSLISEEIIYDVIKAEYVELASILKLMDKASLDHVTDYSNGRKEYVYHLKVKDVIVSYKKEDVIEIKAQEENDILKIQIDYSSLISVLDEDVKKCKLEATISEIGKIEKFSVLTKSDNSKNKDADEE